METVYWTSMRTPWGSCFLAASNNGILRVTLPGEKQEHALKALTKLATVSVKNEEIPLLIEAKKQVLEYFSGQRKTFDLPIDLRGTDFQKKVWRTLRKIPYGKTQSYQDVAIAIGNSKATRAIGLANHNNPVPLIVPCHRVIGKDGSMVGFGGGISLKQRLLKHETSH